jgi:hypothetical protein
VIVRWEGDGGSKETGPDIPAEPEPLRPSPPSPFDLSFRFRIRQTHDLIQFINSRLERKAILARWRPPRPFTYQIRLRSGKYSILQMVNGDLQARVVHIRREMERGKSGDEGDAGRDR